MRNVADASIPYSCGDCFSPGILHLYGGSEIEANVAVGGSVGTNIYGRSGWRRRIEVWRRVQWWHSMLSHLYRSDAEEKPL